MNDSILQVPTIVSAQRAGEIKTTSQATVAVSLFMVVSQDATAEFTAAALIAFLVYSGTDGRSCRQSEAKPQHLARAAPSLHERTGKNG